MRFRIVLPAAPGWPHGQMYREIAETLAISCQKLGHSADIGFNTFSPTAVNVLLGAHDLPPDVKGRVPPSAILYNLEQIDSRILNDRPQFRDMLGRHEVWDYNLQNVERLRSLAKRIFYLPVGFEPEMARIPFQGHQDIDVLFYGALDDRRRAILERIQASHIKLHYLFGVYGPERDHFIQRSRIVLNLHHTDAKVFEIVRVSYLLANKKAVVSELAPETAIEPDIKEAIHGVRYEDVPVACARLLADRKQRRQLERRGFELMSARSQNEYLARLLAERAEGPAL